MERTREKTTSRIIEKRREIIIKVNQSIFPGMKIIITGDSCSGKTTILRALQEKGYSVVFEQGLQFIPPEIERNKLQSNLWFSQYYHQRDSSLSSAHFVIMEYCLQFQYPFSRAQLLSGKITKKEYDQACSLIDQLAVDLPLTKNDLVIHLVCSSEQIIQRLQNRQQKDDSKQTAYRTFLRQATQDYFSAQCSYHKIDTTLLHPEEVVEAVLTMLHVFSARNTP